ncbi:MAG: hypothetical protein OQL06_09750 [Gammaproteobacteria bacterium]|nr:hypothetical protein [Gammaproteobacteria bacterium]
MTPLCPKNKNKSFIIFISIFMFVTPNAYSLEIQESALGMTRIVGKIEKGDKEKISRYLLNQSRPIPPYLFIESPGGDVIESIKIGKMLHSMRATVFAENQCNSACFFVLSGAIRRIAGVDIGLHRPFYEKSYFSSLSSKDAEIKYKNLDLKVKEYLIEMEIPLNIIETMMSTPSSQVTYLSPDYFEKNIPETPSAYSEWLHAKCGSLTKDEKEDFKKISSTESLDINNLPDIIPQQDKNYIIDTANYVSKLPNGYKSYLNTKGNNINKCITNIKKNEWLETQKKYKT